MKEGWWKGFNTTKFHYMIDGYSLCKRWMTFGSDYDPDTEGPMRKDDCKSCYNKLQKRKSDAQVING
jgi:hypothetical protein